MASKAEPRSVTGCLLLLLCGGCAPAASPSTSPPSTPSSSAPTASGASSPSVSSDAEPVPAPAAEPEQPAEPPREYRTQPFRVTVAPATKEPCPREDTSLAELHFSNACVEHSDQGVRLGVMSRGGTGLTWKILSKQDTGRVRFLEIEESVPIRRPGEKVLLEAIEVRAVIPLSNAPGKYTLRVNDACVPFEVKAKVPEKDAAVRICLRDDPFRF